MKFKKCTKCEELKGVIFFSKDKNRSDGFYVYCKLCVKKASRKRYLENKEAIKERNKKWKRENKEYYLQQQREYGKKRSQSLRGKYMGYKREAKARNYSFSLTEEDFSQFWQKPCYYCGGSINTIGLDRVNNDEGYFVDNIVSCCTDCNIAKRSRTKEEYIKHCIKIAKRFEGKYD